MAQSSDAAVHGLSGQQLELLSGLRQQQLSAMRPHQYPDGPRGNLPQGSSLNMDIFGVTAETKQILDALAYAVSNAIFRLHRQHDICTCLSHDPVGLQSANSHQGLASIVQWSRTVIQYDRIPCHYGLPSVTKGKLAFVLAERASRVKIAGHDCCQARIHQCTVAFCTYYQAWFDYHMLYAGVLQFY